MNRTIVIAAGGTGGHVYPGIALGNELVHKGMKVHYIVQANDSSIPVLEKYNYSYSIIDIKGWNRLISFHIFSIIYLCIKSFFQSLGHCKRIEPSVVVGMGGFVALPVGYAAWMLRIPIVIHEQNSYPGLTNRFVAPLAKKIAVSFDETVAYFDKNKTILTGNPVRLDFVVCNANEARKKIGIEPHAFVILLFGGSQGAGSLNKGIMDTCTIMKKNNEKIPLIIHVTGAKDFEKVKSFYAAENIKAIVHSFCYEMHMMYSAADMVIARAGASTITELIHAMKPAILVPYPYATNDHQTKNAQLLLKAGCAEIISDAQATGEQLYSIIKKYMNNSSLLSPMARSYLPFKERAQKSSLLLSEIVISLIKSN